MWAPAFGRGHRGRKPPHNCGASPTLRAGLEAVPLPLGLAQASWDPLKWVPGKSCPQGLDKGWSLWVGRGLGLKPQLGAPPPVSLGLPPSARIQRPLPPAPGSRLSRLIPLGLLTSIWPHPPMFPNSV